jgi:hypothetical protein
MGLQIAVLIFMMTNAVAFGETVASVASRAASLAWPYRFCAVPVASRAGDIADGALDLTGEILRRAGKSILVHGAHSLR